MKNPLEFGRRTTVRVLAEATGESEAEIEQYLRELEQHKYLWREWEPDGAHFWIRLCRIDDDTRQN